MTNAGSTLDTSGVGRAVQTVAWALTACLTSAAAMSAPFGLFQDVIPAATAATQSESDPWWGVVTSETLSVRNGRNAGYDEIARLEKGDLVEVRAFSQFGWATIGVPAGTIGFIEVNNVYDAEEADTVIAANRVKLYYPTENNPLKIWKSVYVEAGTRLTVQERRQTPTADYYAVLMPKWVDAYVPSQFIRRATEAEVAAWEAAHKKEVEAKPDEIPVEGDGQQPRVEAGDNAKPGDDAAAETVQQDEPTDETTEDETAAAEQTTDSVGEGAAPTGDVWVPADDQEQLTVEQRLQVEQEAAALAAAAEAVKVWEGLEAQYRVLVRTPIREAEIEPLIDGYLSLATDPNIDEGIHVRASARVQMLTLRLEYQQAQRNLDQAIREASDPAAVIRVARPPYDVTGVVMSSSVYDGRRLPLLYRIVDTEIGRTLAYFDPAKLPKDTTADQVLGRRVGVTGTPEHEGALSVEVMAIDSLDLLPSE